MEQRTLPKLQRCHAEPLFKQPDKVIIIGKAAEGCNLRDIDLRFRLQIVLRQMQPLFGDKVADGGVKLVTKQRVQCVFGKIKLFAQTVDVNFFGQMLVDILFDLNRQHTAVSADKPLHPKGFYQRIGYIQVCGKLFLGYKWRLCIKRRTLAFKESLESRNQVFNWASAFVKGNVMYYL